MRVPIELELRSHRIDRIVFGRDSAVRDGVLSVSRERLRDHLLEDSRLARVDIESAHPGEPTRIVHVLDAIEPRAKREPRGSAFPGRTGPPLPAGSGSTARLSNMAVIVAGEPPGATNPGFWQESVIDMSGPAARLSTFSAMANLVLVVDASPELSPDESRETMQLCGLRAAEFLGALAVQGRAADAERLALDPPARTLPRVAAILQLESWGVTTAQRTFLYGLSVEGLLPTLLHPNEVLDGALTAGSSHMAAIRNSTYYFQNHALVRELMRRHGRDVDVAGVVVSRAHWESHDGKRRSAAFTARLLEQLGVTAAALTFGHGGHGVTDVALTAEACRDRGIRLSTLMFEMAGVEGGDFALIQMARAADPLVSLGNHQARLSLPAVDRVLGGDELRGITGDATVRRPARAAVDLAVGYLFAVSEPSGSGRLSARAG